MPNPKVCVLGAFVADLTCRTERMPKWGETIVGEAFKMGPGGKGSNQAVAAARLNADVRLITKLGRDAFGDMARKFYQEQGMSLNHVLEDAEESSGTATILVNHTTSENTIVVVPGACGKVAVAEVEAAPEEIASADIFLTQLELPIPPTIRGIEIAHEAGVPVILNPAPAIPFPAVVLSKVDYLTPNETEPLGLIASDADPQDFDTLGDRTLQTGPKNVVLTLADKGPFVESVPLAPFAPASSLSKALGTR